MIQIEPTHDNTVQARTSTQTGSGRTGRVSHFIYRSIVFLLLAVLGLMGGITLGLYKSFSQDLPDIKTILTHRPALITNCYSAHNDIFARFYIEKREIIPIADINPILKQASLAVEDLRFYQHKGIDMLGIFRAMRTNLAAGYIVQGGSTITQQLARALFLSREKKYARKIKEAILSIRIENTLTKSQILELYFNEIYFGHGCYGIQAAAKTFFGKDNKDLSLAECALLAGLPKAPNLYSPYDFPAEAKARRQTGLDRMYEAGFIKDKERQTAENEPFQLMKLKKRRSHFPYFEEYTRQILESCFGTKAVHQGGLRVYTTIDPNIQETSQRALKEGLHAYNRRHAYKGALAEDAVFVTEETFPCPGSYGEATLTAVSDTLLIVSARGFEGTIKIVRNEWPFTSPRARSLKVGDRVVVHVLNDDYAPDHKRFTARLDQEPEVDGAVLVLDVHTGDILAMVGGYSFERSQFNRAIQAIRQPGSAFKPIVYSVALDNNFTASSIIYDSPIVEEIPKNLGPDDFSANSDDLRKLIEQETELWKPENYDSTFLGPTTLRRALEMSRNLVTIHLLSKIGVRQVSRYARSYGLTTKIEEDLSVALGSSGVIPLELTSVYGMFANQGIRCIPRGITKVFAPDGSLLWENLPISFRVLDPQIAYLITYLMQGVIEHGTAQKAAFLDRPLAGKTGTTNDFKDAWFIGFSPDIVVGVWIGFDKLMPLGAGESGATAALPIWIDIMRNILPSFPYKNFTIPDGIEFALIDRKTGLLASNFSKEVFNEAYLAGTAPTFYATEQGPSLGTSRDFSTSLQRMEELSRLETKHNDDTNINHDTEFPSFD
ncbi:PBP1A family penicillin-binding protein [bacterium]|nr:PBP1A family penicillin-binding protein [bacterium]